MFSRTFSCVVIVTVKTNTHQTMPKAFSSNPLSVQFKVSCVWMCSQLPQNSSWDKLSWWENFRPSMLRWWPRQLDNLINVLVLSKQLSTCFRCCVHSYSQEQQLHWRFHFIKWDTISVILLSLPQYICCINDHNLMNNEELYFFLLHSECISTWWYSFPFWQLHNYRNFPIIDAFKWISFYI